MSFTAEGKASAVFEWARDGWPFLDGYLKMNALITNEEEATCVPESDDIVIDDYESFIDGTAPRRFSFQLRIVMPWSDGYDQVNQNAFRTVSSWVDWVNAQFDEGNLPDLGLGDGAYITAIETDQNMPSIDVTNPEEGLAEYIFHGRINYVE